MWSTRRSREMGSSVLVATGVARKAATLVARGESLWRRPWLCLSLQGGLALGCASVRLGQPTAEADQRDVSMQEIKRRFWQTKRFRRILLGLGLVLATPLLLGALVALILFAAYWPTLPPVPDAQEFLHSLPGITRVYGAKGELLAEF